MAGQPDTAGQKNYSLLQRIYLRCLKWIQTPAGIWVLFFIAVAESSFFPIPPDVFLIALCISLPAKSFRYASVCAVGSVLGGMLGYGLGLGFMDTVGVRILDWYGLHDKYQTVQDLYRSYDAWAVGAAGFTPLPYKLFTITAGAFKINFAVFVAMSILSRSARFFLIAWLIHAFGPRVQHFILRYFNLLTIVFLILLIGGFILIKMVF